LLRKHLAVNRPSQQCRDEQLSEKVEYGLGWHGSREMYFPMIVVLSGNKFSDYSGQS
jgi:hypothetical protein